MDNITIICENAINYNSMDEAKALITKEAEIADRTGVKILSKFQLFTPKEIVTEEHREYCIERMLGWLEARELFNYGSAIGQTVFFTIMNPSFIELTEFLKVEYYKVRYHDRFNMDIVNKIIETEKPFFISQSTDHPKNYLDPLFYERQNQINLFCVPSYPAKRKEYHKNVSYYQGISDHTGSVKMLKNSIYMPYWELHVRLTDGYLEDDWSVTLDQLEEVLSHD